MSTELETLRLLSNAFGPSGYEDEVREIVKNYFSELVDEVKIDVLGNVIGVKKGDDNFPTVLLDAHMDEVGFMITHIDKSGFLRFNPLGGFDQRVLYAQKVTLKGDKGIVKGFIGAKAPHLLKPEERNKAPDIDSLFIDIGAASKDEVIEMGIKIGSVGTFDTTFTMLGKNRVMGKAFDDRVGLAVMISVLRRLKESNYNIVAIASVQEEVGLRGARTAAWQVNADFALALEGTAAADTPGTPEHKYSTELGKGPAITLADRSIISHPVVIKSLIHVAESKNIPYQFKRVFVGGTDAGVIHLTREGIPSAVLSIPSRYIHSPAAIIDINDFKRAIELVTGFIEYVSEKFKK